MNKIKQIFRLHFILPPSSFILSSVGVFFGAE